MKTCLACLCVSAVLLGASLLCTAKAQLSKGLAATKAARTESVYSEIAKAPEKARAKHNPLEKDPDAVAAGRILFEQRCSECHGDIAEGGRKGPSLRAAEIQNAEPDTIF